MYNTSPTQSEKLFYKLKWIAALAALTGLGALVCHVSGFLSMNYFLTFFGTPSLVLLFTFAALSRKLHAYTFYRNLVTGLAGGLAGTLAYDLVRYFLQSIKAFHYNGFKAIYIFGGWITQTNPDTAAAAFAGWTYHFWNGLSFGIFYALTFPNKPLFYGVVYGLIMELCMLGLFPFFIQITNKVDFIMLSLIGHVFYGLALGLICKRYTIAWKAQYGNV